MLSVCIIAKNEENTIGRCLNSVSSIAGEIIVADTGSEDNTKIIAEEFGCKVFSVGWNDDFSEARNFTLSKASGDFIFYIDADEELYNPNELLNLLSNAKKETGGYYLPVISVLTDNKQQYSNYQVRLFRNNPKFRFQGAIHEQILNSIKKAGLQVMPASFPIIHYGYDTDKQSFTAKQERNLKIIRKEIAKNKNNSFQRINLIKTFYALNRYDEARNEGELLLQDNILNELEKVSVLNHLALIYYKLNKKNLSYQRAEISVNILKEQFLGNFILAEISSETGKYKNAAKYYSDSIHNDNNLINQLTGDMIPEKSKIYYKAGIAYLKAGDNPNAIKEFEKGLEINPKDLQNLTGLANALFKQRKFQKAMDILKKTKRIYPNVNEIDKYIKQVSLKIPESKDKPQSQPLLSLSMIVKNEEKYLEDCLKSVKDIADEIVIVDTGSSDATKEIAKKYTDKVYDFNWIDDFSAARNEALKRSSGKWILYMDADERIKILNKDKFRSLLEDAEDDIGALIVTIESKHKKLDGSSEMHRGGYPRIFRNFGFPKVHFKGKVHEQIAPSLIDLNKSFLNTDIIMEHLGYDRSYEEMEKKVRRNYRLLLQHVKEEPVNGYAWYQLGQTLAHMNLKEQSEEAIKFAITTGTLNDSVYASACATLAQFTGNRKDFHTSLKYAEESLKKAPEQVYSLNLKAYSLLYLGRKKEAEQDFLKVLKLIDAKRGVPKSGFDIDIPKSVVLEGLKKSRE